jgi:hypothetical protein
MNYNNIAFLPIELDIPEEFHPHSDYPTKWHWWSLEQLLEYDGAEAFENKPWRKTLTKEYDVYKSLVNQLPLVDLSNVRLTVQRTPVEPHIDLYKFHRAPQDLYDHFIKNEPCGYRFVLKGSNDTLQLFLNGVWTTAKLPRSPSCYLINTTSVMHRVLNDPDRTTLYVRGTLDEGKHQEFIRKNLEIYKDYALYI